MPIPPAALNSSLPSLEVKKNVLALYPGTTTFYKAEVVDGWKSGGGASGGAGGTVVKKEREDKEEREKEREGGADKERRKGEYVTLRFEGEDEVEMVNSVERRYVLPDKAG